MASVVIGRLATLLGGLAVAATGFARPAYADVAGARPWTAPALRQWASAAGSYQLPSIVTVVVAPQDFELLGATADELAGTLGAATGRSVAVERRSSSPATGEVHLKLGAGDPELGAEGYQLMVGSAVVIRANAATGVYYGTRSLLQLLHQSPTIPAGVARDWPRYAERGLLVDLGRKPYTYAWLADRIRELGSLKLNRLHLHFTETLGWRIESSTPGVHSPGAFTHAQVRDLLDLATLHGVQIVPEVDMPGHLGAGLRNYPQFQLKNVLGQASAERLDYTNPQARAWAAGLVAEYADLFPGPDFHIGGDEFMPSAELLLHPQLQRYARTTYGSGATAKDGVIGFLNELGAQLRNRGKRARVWNDGIGGGKVVRLHPATDVGWWTDISPLGDLVGLPTPQALIDAGHRIVNHGWYPTYYTTVPLPPRPDVGYMYESWAVHRFHGAVYLNGDIGTPWHTVAPGEPANRGSLLNLWNDDPAAAMEAEDAVGIAPRLAVMAQKTWDTEPLVPTYAEFQGVVAATAAGASS
ncbi:MAG TPA: beta-N-acetylhexosaminidase [Nocardioidaceae bacterium]|nr:beta-N-acetylhexosaminidase [Nocardioidaceae bacterium]